MKAVSAVLPFRVNSYVVDTLIDWSAIPEDPIYKLVFPQPGMLPQDDLTRLMALVEDGRITSYNVCYTKLLRTRL